ncbi:carboxymuconolactone decarboxylase family protein [Streptomyces sp. I05A-00742]|uniref:carboxymuconolactone decarboxylase family protein n=1 Tax=Streptomyces sp. I05A-00742 TaxID=2732853 RepID=UPI00148764F5|nr:carboxymuconolactone decarboxylase family protein [Streptomyces sp. I05A-00742]
MDVPSPGTSSGAPGRPGIGVGVGREAAFGAGARRVREEAEGVRSQGGGAKGPVDVPTADMVAVSAAARAEAGARGRRQEERPAGAVGPGTADDGEPEAWPGGTAPSGTGADGPSPEERTGRGDVERRAVPPVGAAPLTAVRPDTRPAAAAHGTSRARHRAGGAYSADALTVVGPVPGADGVPSGQLDVRRRVLGEAHGETAGADPFTREFEDFATRVTWDEAWSRPGLDPRTRALLTLTALTVGGHLRELPAHARAALRLGVTPGEIQETLRQTALYAGLPAARAAFAAVRPVVTGHPDEPDQPDHKDQQDRTAEGHEGAPGAPEAHP